MEKESLQFLERNWVKLQDSNCAEALLLKAALLCADGGFENHATRFFRRILENNPAHAEVSLEFVKFLTARRLFCSAARVCATALQREGAHSALHQRSAELERFRYVPSVSLIIPCYNDADTIPLVVQAARRQSVCVNEIILIDDCSTDGSAARAAELGVTVVRLPENLGPGLARNAGITAARGEVLAFLDADTVPHEFWLEHLLIELLEGGYAGAGGRLVEYYQSALVDAWRSMIMGNQYVESDFESSELHGANMVFQTAAVRAVGGYRAEYSRSSEDLDLCRRLCGLGARIRYVHTALCHHYAPNSLESLLRTVNVWRQGPNLRQGTFNSFESLEQKWKAALRDDIALMNGLIEKGSGWLIYPSYLNVFWSITADLAMFIDLHGSSADETAALALAALLGAMESGTQGPELRAAVQRDLRPVIETLAAAAAGKTCPQTENAARAALAGHIAPVPQDSYAADPAFILNQLPALFTTVGFFGKWLLFGAERSRLTQASIAALPRRAALVDADYLLSVRRKEEYRRRSALNFFPEETGAWEAELLVISARFPARTMSDLLARVAGYAPRRIILTGTKSAVEESFLALCEAYEPEEWEVRLSAG